MPRTTRTSGSWSAGWPPSAAPGSAWWSSSVSVAVPPLRATRCRRGGLAIFPGQAPRTSGAPPSARLTWRRCIRLIRRMSSASPAARGSPASRPVSGASGATRLAGPEVPTRPAVAAPGTASRVPRAVTARLEQPADGSGRSPDVLGSRWRRPAVPNCSRSALAIVAALVAAGAVGARRPERLVEPPEHAFRGASRRQVALARGRLERPVVDGAAEVAVAGLPILPAPQEERPPHPGHGVRRRVRPGRRRADEEELLEAVEAVSRLVDGDTQAPGASGQDGSATVGLLLRHAPGRSPDS